MEFKTIILLASVTLLAGCFPPKPEVVTVKVPTPVIIKIEKPVRPVLESEFLLVTDSPDVVVKALEIDILQLINYAESYELLIDTHNNFQIDEK